MLRNISICFLLFTGIQIFAQSNSGKRSATTKMVDDHVQLSALNHQFIQNFLHNDTVAHNKIIYKDFACVVANGAIVDRDNYMKGWSHGYDPQFYKSFVMQNEFIRIFGNTALVRAETYYSFIQDGKEVFNTTVYIDTYLKIDGRWWCVQVQFVPKK